MRVVFAAAALATLCFLGTQVRAADDDARKEKGGAIREKALEKYDTNKNGKLDPDEIEKAKGDRKGAPDTARKPAEGGGERMREEMIKRFDKDGDGKLNEEEKTAAMEAMKKRRAEGGGPGGRPDIAELIKKFDKDGDGKLNEEEKAAAMASRKRPDGAAPGGRPDMAELIKKFDKNGDGKLDEEEKAAAKKSFAERRKGDK